MEGLQVLDGDINEKSPCKCDFATAQRMETYCKDIAPNVGNPEAVYSYEGERVLVRHSKIENSIQKFVSSSLRAKVLRLKFW